jgi:hypothetical protein
MKVTLSSVVVDDQDSAPQFRRDTLRSSEHDRSSPEAGRSRGDHRRTLFGGSEAPLDLETNNG